MSIWLIDEDAEEDVGIICGHGDGLWCCWGLISSLLCGAAGEIHAELMGENEARQTGVNWLAFKFPKL
jgi:hypothetical protein